MDADRFDTLARSLTSVGTRRRALVAALGGALGLLGLADPDAGRAARSAKCRRTPGECERCRRGRCERKDGEKHCKAGKIKPKTSGTPCRLGTCQAGQCISPTGQIVSPPPPPPPGCVPEPPATTCDGRCGVWRNNCGHAVTCRSCPTGQDCLLNGTCARPCTGVASDCADCADGEVCSFETTEGEQHCVTSLATCVGLKDCTKQGTAGCPLGFHCQPCGEELLIRCVPVDVCPASPPG